MKTLMKAGGIKRKVHQLDGYLRAIRDMNDDHAGKRYWFWADMLVLKKESIFVLIHKYLKD